MLDGIVKNPYASLRFIPRHCNVIVITNSRCLKHAHSSVFARLASEAFYDAAFYCGIANA